MQSTDTKGADVCPPFQLQMIQPYSTLRADGTPTPTDFVVDGLLTAGGLSVLGAKPKVGKSSLARYLATCVTSGRPFLGRTTTRGEVMLVSLEDPRSHTDNCLKALGYDLATDAPIHIVEQVSPKRQETVAEIREALAKNPNIRLIIIDHLAPFLNIADISEYMPTLRGLSLLHDLARDYPRIHILCLAHAKKVLCTDPFDTILGSTALRGVPDTNIVLMNEQGRRIIVSETRVGRAIPATILSAQMVTVAGSDVAEGYALGEAFNLWDNSRKEKAEAKRTEDYKQRVVEYLATCEGGQASQKDTLDGVEGKTAHLVQAIKALEAEGVVTATGTPKCLRLNLEDNALALYRLGQKEIVQ